MTTYRETQMTSGLVYQHMSNHYRRILNAKAAVDTSTPESFKARAKQSSANRRFSVHRNVTTADRHRRDRFEEHLDSKEYRSLMERIVPITACHGITSHDHWRTDRIKERGNGETNNLLFRGSTRNLFISVEGENATSTPYPGSLSKERKTADLLDMHDNYFKASLHEYWPRILKSKVNSKLRNMRVYHPPRRKPNKVWEELDRRDMICSGAEECTCPAVNKSQCGNEQSQASSRDSAYNGGNDSTSDSRSPTPHHPLSRHFATQTEPFSISPAKSIPTQPQLTQAKRADELEYTRFVHAITQEAAENGHYTNKSLSRIIQKHIQCNLHRLDKKKMLERVNKLRNELELPSDDFDDILTPYPTITTDQIGSKETKQFESWTAHYFMLSNSNSSGKSKTRDSLGSNISDKLHSLNISDNEIESDYEANSNSSRGTTIKEAIRAIQVLSEHEYSSDEFTQLTSNSDEESPV